MRSFKSLLIWLVIFAVAAAIAQYVQDRGQDRDKVRSQDRSQDRGAPQTTPSPAGPPQQTASAISGRARVVDGDSLIIGTSRIRLFGIDAPEGRQDCRDAQDNNYRCGETSKRALSAQIGGRAVNCTPVGTSHDRSVAVCTVEGRDLSEAMVRGGHAVELRQHSRGRFSAAEREARDARRGLWAGTFERPGRWRQGHPRY
jgi:endonuclease YncB( thermonuclease family)